MIPCQMRIHSFMQGRLPKQLDVWARSAPKPFSQALDLPPNPKTRMGDVLGVSGQELVI